MNMSKIRHVFFVLILLFSVSHATDSGNTNVPFETLYNELKYMVCGYYLVHGPYIAMTACTFRYPSSLGCSEIVWAVEDMIDKGDTTLCVRPSQTK